MNALEKLNKREANGEKLTSLEFAVFWCTDLISGIKAAEELADYELRLDLLAKGATWEHDENELLKDKLSAKDAEIAAYKEFVNAVKETLELHESHWKFHFSRNLDELTTALQEPQ